jgi:acetyltransferase-like isoleucine patch superfamily enzyme
VKFVWVSFLLTLLKLTWLPPIRAFFLRLCGARIGRDTVIHPITLINVDRGGFGALSIGADCFIGDEVLFDLAAPVVIEDQVTLATRAMVLTHLNVGYADHPLQQRFPSKTAGVTIRRGSFVGAGATILAGCTVGPEAFVGATAFVDRDLGAGEIARRAPKNADSVSKPSAESGV